MKKIEIPEDNLKMYQNVNEKDRLKVAFEQINENGWYCNKKITCDNVTEIQSSTSLFAESLKDDDKFLNVFHYVSAIAYDFDETPKADGFPVLREPLFQEAKEEAYKWNNNGKLCAYATTLLYELLLHEDAVNPHHLHFYQGCFIYSFKNNPLYRLMAEEAVHPHVFLLVGETYVDPSVAQISKYFPEDKFFHGLYEIPEDMKLYGREEPRKIVDRYNKKIRKQFKKEKEEWLNYHKKCMELFIIEEEKTE